MTTAPAYTELSSPRNYLSTVHSFSEVPMNSHLELMGWFYLPAFMATYIYLLCAKIHIKVRPHFLLLSIFALLSFPKFLRSAMAPLHYIQYMHEISDHGIFQSRILERKAGVQESTEAAWCEKTWKKNQNSKTQKKTFKGTACTNPQYLRKAAP